MARPLRIEYPGAFYHVMHRGNHRSAIFKSTRDREKLFEYFAKAVERYRLKIHTYCLMTNHYHLLIETPEPNLSQAIKWINGSYAIYLSRKMTAEKGVELGRYFGGISGAGITVRYKYIAKNIEKDKTLRKRIEQIRKQIINN